MTSSDPHIEISLDRPSPFQGGDVVTGKVAITSSSGFKASHIFISLVCEKETRVEYRTKDEKGSEKTKEARNAETFYRRCVTLFPEKKVRESLQQLRSGRAPKDLRTNFKLKAGSYEYRFTFELPKKSPISLWVGYGNSISWSLTAQIDSSSWWSGVASTDLVVLVHREPKLVDQTDCVHWTFKPRTVNVYLSGYLTAVKTVSGFFNNLVRDETEHRRYGNVVFHLNVPKSGFPQSPKWPLNISLDVESTDMELLVLHKVSVRLHREATVTVYTEQAGMLSDTFCTKYTVFERKDIGLPLEIALKWLNYGLKSARLPHYLNESLDRGDPGDRGEFEVEYTLCVELALANKFNPKRFQKKRWEVPIKVSPLQTAEVSEKCNPLKV